MRTFVLTLLVFASAVLAQSSPPAIVSTAPHFNNGVFACDVLAANDTWFAMQSSSDLTGWQSVANFQVQLSNRFPFTAAVAGQSRMFFRAQTPPPLRVSPASVDLLAGSTQNFSAILKGVAGNTSVTWSVVEPSGGTVTTGGVYTAPSQAGTYHGRAVSRTDASVVLDVPVHIVTVNAAEQARFDDTATYSDSVQGDALLIMKDGAVVYEHYTGTTPASSSHLLASGTKSFNVALFAMGVAMGIWTLDENVSQTITEWQGVPNKSQITIRQLISLTSGLLDSPLYSATPSVIATLDTYDLAINGSTTPQAPGVACIYAPSNFQVLAAMFERKTGLDPAQFLYDRLLARLGFSAAHLALWTRDVNGKPQMAGGAYFAASAWANYGKLWLQNGVWEGQTLLTPATMQSAVTYDNLAFKGYGFTWWLNLPTGTTYNPGVDQIPADGRGDGTQIATNVPADMFMAAGTGKQRLYVIPSLGLVIVRFGHGVGSSFSDHTFLGKIIGAP